MCNILFLIKKQNTEYLNNPTQKKKKRNSKKQVEEKKVQERKQMKQKREPSTSSEEEDTDTKQSNSVPPQKEKKNLQTNPLLITFINDQIKKNVLVVKHTLSQKTWFSKYVCTGQDHFWMEHDIKTRGKHQCTSMLLTSPVYVSCDNAAASPLVNR